MKKNTVSSVRRSLAILLSLALLLTTIVTAIAAPTKTVSWDGSIADSYAGGTGTEKDPYQIATAAELARLVNDRDTAGRYYKLTADIVVNGDLTNSPKSWFVGTDNNDTTSLTFKGDFDGDGHTVSGLYVNKTGGDYWTGTGLFPKAHEGAKIRNVGVVHSSLTVEGGMVGSIVGYIFTDKGYEDTDPAQPVIERCYADETVTLSGANAGGIAGGLIGQTLVQDCYFTGNGAAGGVYAAHWSNYVVVKRFYTTSALPGGDVQYTNVYSTVGEAAGAYGNNAWQRTVEQMTGDAALEGLAGFDFTAVWKTDPTGTPTLRVFDKAAVPGEGWDGSIAGSYAGGTGTEKDPYQIATAAELARLVNDRDTAGRYYKLTADIVVNGDLTNSPKSWFVGTDNNDTTSLTFKGDFDGDGHTVSGLYVNKTGGDYWTGTGLFPKAHEGAKIRNVGVVHSSLTVEGGMVGSIVGYIFTDKGYEDTDPAQPVIERCYADETVTLSGANAGGIAGGLIGQTLVQDCYFTGNGAAGGVYAAHWSNYVVVKRFYTTSALPGGDVQYTNVYSTVGEAAGAYGNNAWQRTVEQMTGEAAKENLDGFDFNAVWQTNEGGLPTLRKPDNKPIEPGTVWSGRIATDYAGGSGTKTDPYQIATAEQLAKLVNDPNTEGRSYVLTHDIVLNDTTAEDWYTAGSPKMWYSVNDDTAVRFQGHLEGSGHTVSGLYYGDQPGRDGYRSGLFPMVGGGAVIRNVGVTRAYMSGFSNVGSIVGWSHDTGNHAARPVITGCYADETVVLKGMRTGGIVGAGSLAVAVDNCFFAGSMEATESIMGGITAFFWSGTQSIVHCYSVDHPIHEPTSGATYELRDCYSNVEQANVRLRTKAQMTGEAARSSMTALEWDTIWVTAEDKTPRLLPVAAEHQVNGNNGTPGAVWSGQVATDYAGGTGTENDPYQIATGEQLAKLVSGLVNATQEDPKGVYYELTHDIVLNDTAAADWKDNAHAWFYSTWQQYEVHHGFRGHLNGNGHTVSGIYLDVVREGQVLAGLIPVIGESGVVENIGVIHSYIRGSDTKHGMGCVGALVGYCYDWTIPEDNDATGLPATIRGCFSDRTVTVIGNFVSGILGASPRAIRIENCYATGPLEVEGDGFKGGLTGYNWCGSQVKSPLVNCYAANDAKDPAVGKCFDSTVSTNVYGLVFSQSKTRILSLRSMRGANARQYMDGFDFDNIWYACEDGTPVLRAFGTTSKYSNKSPFDKVQITFVTNGGNEVDPIVGEEGEKIVWPTVTRYGYKFMGWHVYRELDCEYPLDVFPMNNVTLYAKWEAVGIFQGFEQFDADTLLGDGLEHYHMGRVDYDVDKVYEGGKSVRWLGTADSGKLVLFDKDDGQLTPGTEYDLTFWVYVDSDTVPQLTLLPMGRAKASADPAAAGLALPALNGAKRGQWQQVSYRFVAESKYLALSVIGGGETYFDEVAIVPTGKTTERTDATPTGDTTSATVAVLLLAAALAGVFACRRRKAMI